MNKKITIKKVLKFAFIGFTIFFIAMLFFMTVHDTFTGSSSQTANYCSKFGFFSIAWLLVKEIKELNPIVSF